MNGWVLEACSMQDRIEMLFVMLLVICVLSLVNSRWRILTKKSKCNRHHIMLEYMYAFE